MKLLPRHTKPKGFFVQSLKVLAEQKKCKSPLRFIQQRTVTAKKLLQHSLSAAGISGRAGDGQEVFLWISPGQACSLVGGLP